MTASPLPIPVDRFTAERDREEAWCMWLSFGWALTAQRAPNVEQHLYGAFSAFRQLSFGMQTLFADAFKAAYAAGIARRTLLEHEAELAYAQGMVVTCEAEVSRCACQHELASSHVCALESVVRWRRRVSELEGRGR